MARTNAEAHGDFCIATHFANRDTEFERCAKRHLRETHSPETLLGLAWTKAPRDQPYDIVQDFRLQPVKRTDRAMAPCPLCCLHSPKYYEGSLAWFPSEGVYRCIGRDCASHHIGTIEARLARKRYERAQQSEADFEFVFDNLGLVPEMIQCVERATAAAKEIERLSYQFGRVVAVRKSLYDATRDHHGRLTLYEPKLVDQFDFKTGKIEPVTQYQPLDFGVLKGAQLLRGHLGYSLELRSVLVALQAISQGEENEAQQWTFASCADAGALAQATGLLRQSARRYLRVEEKLRDTFSFFSEANFVLLKNFGEHTLNANRFRASCLNGEFVISLTTSRVMRVRPNFRPLEQLLPWPAFVKDANRRLAT
jgi:hypothetical protein